MRRPVGVIITCILLGLAALLLLLNAFGAFVSILLRGHLPANGAGPTPPPAMMAVVFIVLGLFYLALAAWAIATLVGLVKMRNWARYSVIVIGVGLALMGVVGAIGMFAARTMMDSVPMPPGQNPAILRVVMVVAALFSLLIAAVGIWWIIYFALRTTREAFALAAGPQPVPIPGYIPPPSPYDPSSYAVASYIPAPDPNAPPPITAPVIMLDQAAAANTAPRRPVTITVIAWLLIVSGGVTLPCCLLPFPMFFFGVVMSGWAAHLTAVSFAVLMLLAGIGLLRLEKMALYLAYAMTALGLVNGASLLMPSVRDRMIAYQMDLMQKFSMGMPQPFDNHMMALMMLPGLLLGVAYCLALLILLFLNRAAFDRPNQAAAA
ncbi:MAG TPA: hypothetical protein VFC39_03365 [Acidobacteriaceae bacterium]|nr:hypothetical protein [Acidobacteriaceae bacterium]